jgi:hypothetical protein
MCNMVSQKSGLEGKNFSRARASRTTRDQKRAKRFRIAPRSLARDHRAALFRAKR